MRAFTLSIKVALVSAFLHGAPAAADNRPAAIDKPGTVVGERWHELGHGYRAVTRSVVNGPESFEGIGHFPYVYYKDRLLCDCSHVNVLISPTGTHALFAEGASGKLVLFNAQALLRRELSQTYVGTPRKGAWDLSSRQVVVTLDKYEDDDTVTTATVIVPL